MSAIIVRRRQTEDPAIRSDGRCALLRCTKLRPREDDPFCSTECARAFYGVKSNWSPRVSKEAA